ncbi:uncharacterized protein VTP21DRAFT_10919 [Calcarisporiella thermophila]|uniref:uncharacterized protein n=1 Tax=Calcarisporiella thermophila TaxID=911321 RepID=UPI0037427BE3
MRHSSGGSSRIAWTRLKVANTARVRGMAGDASRGSGERCSPREIAWPNFFPRDGETNGREIEEIKKKSQDKTPTTPSRWKEASTLEHSRAVLLHAPWPSPPTRRVSTLLLRPQSPRRLLLFLPSCRASTQVGEGVQRQRSLTRPERQRVDPAHPQYHTISNRQLRQSTISSLDNTYRKTYGASSAMGGSRRPPRKTVRTTKPHGPSCWIIFCYFVTCYAPSFLLSACGKKSYATQRAWREKMGLITIIVLMSAIMGFFTFGFTSTACHDSGLRFAANQIQKGTVVINGKAYVLDRFEHPAAPDIAPNSNPLYPPLNMGGKDISFLFQKVNVHCLGLITVQPGVDWNQRDNMVPNYFPCVALDQDGSTSPNPSANPSRTGCHTSNAARMAYYKLKENGEVFYTWDDINSANRSLVVYNKLDPFLDSLRQRETVRRLAGTDATLFFIYAKQRQVAECLADITRVGVIDTRAMGCIASDIVLYLMLVVILGVVLSKFTLAVIFGWFLSWRLGTFKKMSYAERRKREAEIERWTENIDVAAPAIRPSSTVMGSSSRLSALLPPPPLGEAGGELHQKGSRGSMVTTDSQHSGATPWLDPNPTPPDSSSVARSVATPRTNPAHSRRSSLNESVERPCPLPLAEGVVPQPSAKHCPFNFPLVHTLCLVTCYSEGRQGIRATLDSLATTDYPNSHKLLLVIADGLVTGAGNRKPTPDIVLSMMQDLIVQPDEVQPQSYVSIADGSKRHNMAKVFAGFYKYDPRTVKRSRQKRVPIVLIAKCGTPEEAGDHKPGNRGKRDSQVILMSFLQKAMFDERLTMLEYELFNSIWRVTGVSPDRYEILMMVDADTRVYPDSVTRMVAAMTRDHSIMGLCGETRIGNKANSWVTMIQVFEYYISHHLSKAFESVFGGVTCLPGCFCMYRIKAPKGPNGYWVPILANPDIVVNYSENVVDTLHKKNLLLLGEDRFLSTLMLRTFPKRKLVFVPQAVCKTVVPDRFGVLLSQRRRWINSTVHNLMELVLVRHLCGTFCFSMQFIIALELIGTLVLPAAICFTIYLLVELFIGHPEIIPLVLLALILFLPAVLIVLTSRKLSYVGWMLVYLLALPLWNFILPVYAFWHFDDFTWGQTRRVAGERRARGEEEEGEFDSSQIVMKRWAEFERERRMREAFARRGLGEASWGAAGGDHYRNGSEVELPPPALAAEEQHAMPNHGHAGPRFSAAQEGSEKELVPFVSRPLSPVEARHEERMRAAARTNSLPPQPYMHYPSFSYQNRYSTNLPPHAARTPPNGLGGLRRGSWRVEYPMHHLPPIPRPPPPFHGPRYPRPPFNYHPPPSSVPFTIGESDDPPPSPSQPSETLVHNSSASSQGSSTRPHSTHPE